MILTWTMAALILAGGSTAWVGAKAVTVKMELEAATGLLPVLKQALVEADTPGAASISGNIRAHTSAARSAVEDPIWTITSALPWIGASLSATSEIARSADDISTLAIGPLVRVFDSLKWDALMPGDSVTDLEPLRRAAPSVSAAAHAVRSSEARLLNLDSRFLLPDVSDALTQARNDLAGVSGALSAAADVATLAPAMLGADEKREYLLIVQNNAETRASGGIPGALALLTLDQGKLRLSDQTGAGGVGIMSPALPVDEQQELIYSGRLGTFMQDINLTPDFPTAAHTAQAMWKAKTGRLVDGVISVDPVALAYVLDAIGPVRTENPDLVSASDGRLPKQVTGKNVVRTLMSDVYKQIEDPKLQDLYFAGVARNIFGALSRGQGEPGDLVGGITKGVSERRILLWSGLPDEQASIRKYVVSGSVAGPSVSPAQFGVFFNDGTGAKMDFYVKRTAQLIQRCSTDDYGQVTVRVTSTNTASADAHSTLSNYVTGGGKHGVPPGTVQTNIVVYGPDQANVETVTVGDRKTPFASHRHGNRPVGVVTVRLAPGELSTVDISFSGIVQHTLPQLVVTPTLRANSEVILSTKYLECSGN